MQISIFMCESSHFLNVPGGTITKYHSMLRPWALQTSPKKTRSLCFLVPSGAHLVPARGTVEEAGLLGH